MKKLGIVLLTISLLLICSCDSIPTERLKSVYTVVDFAELDFAREIKGLIHNYFLLAQGDDFHIGEVRENGMLSPTIHSAKKIDEDMYLVLCSPTYEVKSIWLFAVQYYNGKYNVRKSGYKYVDTSLRKMSVCNVKFIGEEKISVSFGIFPEQSIEKNQIYVEAFETDSTGKVSHASRQYIVETEILENDTGFITILPIETETIGDVYYKRFLSKKIIY